MGLRQPVQFFTRTTYINADICSSDTTDVTKGYKFALSDVPNYTEFTSLYDQYQLKAVQLTFIPRYNVATNLTPIAQLWSIVDYDASFPTTQPGFLQYQNLHMTRGTSLHKRYIRPQCLGELFNNLTTSAYSTRRNTWIDTADPNVPHYGMALLVPTVANADSKSCWDLKVKYYFAFKNVR